MTGLQVVHPGIHSLVQDAGRFGLHNIGLTVGGPIDKVAFHWANRLCGNQLDLTAIEVTLGGLILRAQVKTTIAVTGAQIPLTINGIQAEIWQSHHIKPGDLIKFGFARSGARAYLAIAKGFNIPKQFSSNATVCREEIGGLNGYSLRKDDLLPSQNTHLSKTYVLYEKYRPKYDKHAHLRCVLGYQEKYFDSHQKDILFNTEYKVTPDNNRMGYRLKGKKVNSNLNGIISEGICHGAIQIPADGQPIILLNDRQTIGGYPKIGSVISADTNKLGQLIAGNTVNFEAITIEQAQNLFRENLKLFQQIPLHQV